MRKIFLILIIFVVIPMNAQNLSDYRWKKRLVLLVSFDFESSLVKSQIQCLEKTSIELKERDMLMLKLYPTDQKLTVFNIGNNFEGVLLIGKDGGLKARYPYVVKPNTLFELVDSMPMRKSEMRKKKGR
ncbi:DUF4174 domain-containing protein [Muricauda sp. JGD-17]|uniref:DUF4174 domain-containing protein n=1 Tax=Flagellimonas ochracea TaxID=2696472 RepID=A0A964TCS5_9FLAO|nr:DUF4174 domain-containing protein [Allomuricauda ochracea]NAY92490.1 DUF4174 domain-containing protein [Allomuricauda ochracea]